MSNKDLILSLYKSKYLKYKNKYLSLQKIGGGIEDITNMTIYIKENMPDSIFTDEILREIKLEYKDITLKFLIKNNKCIILSFSRGHFIRENPEHKIPFITPSEIGDPASLPGDGAIFLALVVIHCEKYIIEWSAYILSKWWEIKGVCSIPDACIKNVEKERIIINTEKFLIWAKTILNIK